MKPELIYHCPLHDMLLAEAKLVDSWIVTLSDGFLLLTLIYQDSRLPAGRQLVTRICYVTPQGHAERWAPGMAYTSGVICAADEGDYLLGFDFYRPGQLYLCKFNGEHLATLEVGFVPDPSAVQIREKCLHWRNLTGDEMVAELQSDFTLKPSSVAVPGDADAIGRMGVLEESCLHSPRAHFTADSSLYLIDELPHGTYLLKYKIR